MDHINKRIHFNKKCLFIIYALSPICLISDLWPTEITINLDYLLGSFWEWILTRDAYTGNFHDLQNQCMSERSGATVSAWIMNPPTRYIWWQQSDLRYLSDLLENAPKLLSSEKDVRSWGHLGCLVGAPVLSAVLEYTRYLVHFGVQRKLTPEMRYEASREDVNMKNTDRQKKGWHNRDVNVW